MATNIELNKKVFEAVLAQALKDDMLAEFESVPKETDHVFSDRFERKMNKLIKRSDNAKPSNRTRASVFRPRFNVFAMRAAVFATAAAFCVFVGAMPPVSACVQGLLVKIFPQYDSYTFEVGTSKPIDFYSVKSEWLPNGYYLKTAECNYRW